MIADIPLADVMKKEIIVLHPKDTIDEAKRIFKTYHIHHIPIAVNQELVGIISLGDLLVADKLMGRHKDKFPAGAFVSMNTIDEIMTPNPYCVKDTDTLSRALNIMKEKRINCLPVISSSGLLAGIITSFDIINILSNNIGQPNLES